MTMNNFIHTKDHYPINLNLCTSFLLTLCDEKPSIEFNFNDTTRYWQYKSMKDAKAALRAIENMCSIDINSKPVDI